MEATSGQYNATPPTLSTGQSGFTQVDQTGNQKVTLATKIAGEDLTSDVMKVELQMSNAVISTATTTTVKTGSGLLHSIVVTGGTAGTILVYDNTAASGTILASFDSTNAIAGYIFNSKFSTGLTIVTSAATKLSINFR